MAIKLDLRQKPLDGDLLLTMACPVGCEFCIYSCLPSLEPQKWMSEETIRRVAEEYSKNNIAIRICGGEPFYNLEKLKKCINILLEYYDPFHLNIITSAIFAGTRENTLRNLKIIKDANFDRLVVSVDRFHLPRVSYQKIINTIETSRDLGIDIILRLSLDTESCPLIDNISEIIVKYQTPIEVHDWSIVGRAENLNKSVLENYSTVEKYIFKKIAFFGEKYNLSKDYRYYLTDSPKRSQWDSTPAFFPTTFPNGNVYASSYTFKSEYMGNINSESLLKMIYMFKNSFFGHFLLEGNGHSQMRNFVPEKFKDQFDISRNEPFLEEMPEEAIGRRFVVINTEHELDEIYKYLNENRRFHGPYGVEEREYLLSFRLNENDLWNNRTASKIQNFLEKLKSEKIKFVLSRPLPPCLKIKIDDKQPKNCFECREMFSVQDGVIKFCEPLKNKFGPKLSQVTNREDICSYFNAIHKNMKIPDICKSCMYNIRGICNSMCLIE